MKGPVDPDVLVQLATLDAPAVSNAVRRLRAGPHDEGVTRGGVRQISGGICCGTAVTATMRATPPDEGGVSISELHRAVHSRSGPVVVVMQDLDEPAGVGAFLGEVNGTALRALGVQGFVTNGRVRDVADLRRLGFAVHAAGLCVPRAYMRLVAVDVPVMVDGLEVAPGDVVHADEHGVQVIPDGLVGEVIETAEQIRVDEQEIVAWALSDAFDAEQLFALPRFTH